MNTFEIRDIDTHEVIHSTVGYIIGSSYLLKLLSIVEQDCYLVIVLDNLKTNILAIKKDNEITII